MRILSLSLLAALLLAPAVHAVPVTGVPDPRPRSAVVDMTGTLTSADIQQIDALASRARAGGELFVAVIHSVDGVPPRSYTTQLFNRLRLDTSERNRGVLLLAALGDRKAEIVVGDGFEDSVTSTTDRIMRDTVVSHFRQGDPRGALVQSAQALVHQVLLAAAPSSPEPSHAMGSDGPETAPAPVDTPAPRRKRSLAGFISRVRRINDEYPMATLGGLGGFCLAVIAGIRRYFRMRPRVCEHCGQQMVRLDEDADDAHLQATELSEERVGSVDYDIWMCPGCQHTLKLRYGAIFTRYSRCTRCKAKTLGTRTTTLQAATEYSTGRARVDEDCEHCGYHRSYTRTIPRKPRSSSSSSSGGGSSSGRGSSGSW